MTRQRAAAFGMFGLGVGYFLWYTPYSALAKSISGGLLPGMEGSVGGLVLLPAHVLGQLLAMPVFVLASGWWRYAGRRRIAGHDVPFPSRFTGEAAVWMAVIVLTTTLNFTFPGASIVFMLVLMRIGTLIISPTMDLVRRWRIHWYSAVALVLCLVSAAVALADIDNYTLTVGAMLSLGLYCIGYTLRFRVMSARAKTGDRNVDRRYFIEEHMATPVIMLAMVAVPALLDIGPWMHALRIGFTTFLGTPEVFAALLIGVCYEGLFIMTSLIFLDPREFSFCMPVHVYSSLLAGVAASLALSGLYGLAPPSAAQYVAALAVSAAAIVLCSPTIRARVEARRRSRPAARRSLLFVCGGNTSRSPMAAAIARAGLETAGNGRGGALSGRAERWSERRADRWSERRADRRADRRAERWSVDCAGVSVGSPGAPISPEAATALIEMGVQAPLGHRSRALTPEMCAGDAMVYCMTRAQRASVLALAPAAAGRTVCLDPEDDVPDPAGQPPGAYRDCAERLRTLIRDRLRELRDGSPPPAPENP